MATMSHRDLKQLEGRLDKGLGKIRARKVQFPTTTHPWLIRFKITILFL
jgi:hypothetical protein